MTLDEVVKQLELAYGGELRAVVLYGSAAAGEHNPKRSNYNLLVIVETLPLDRLRAAAAVARAWSESGNPPPLTLTTAEWRSSVDIFPMEYADILERHRVLFGVPPFDGIKVERQHLRLEVEQQTMGKLLQFRQGILHAGGDAKRHVGLLEDSLSTFMVIFRGIVRLHGDQPSTDYEALSRDIAQRAGFDPAPFVRVVRHVRGVEKLPREAAEETLAGYLAGMQQLVAYLNRFR